MNNACVIFSIRAPLKSNSQPTLHSHVLHSKISAHDRIFGKVGRFECHIFTREKLDHEHEQAPIVNILGMSIFLGTILKVTNALITMLQRHLYKRRIFFGTQMSFLAFQRVLFEVTMVKKSMDYGFKLTLVLLHTQHSHDDVQQQTTYT